MTSTDAHAPRRDDDAHPPITATVPGGRSPEDWERPAPRSPLVRWRPAGVALVLLLIVAAAWWAVAWLTSPAPPPVPGSAAGQAGVAVEGVSAHPSGPSASPAPSAAAGAGPASIAEGVTPTRGSAPASVSGPAGESGTPGASVRVHVVGEVHRPGVVTVPAGGRVEDAVRAAGGTTRAARTERINLAAPVQDGQQVLIPDARTELDASAVAGSAPAAPSGGPASHPAASAGSTTAGTAIDASGTVDLNTADLAALQTLPGVGPATAEKIIAHRESVGPFTGLQDLDAVPGIGPASLERLRDRVRW